MTTDNGEIVRYNRSFEARLIQSDDETKHQYNEIKNGLLSYETCKSSLSWKRETFKAKHEVVAKLAFRGKTLCVFVALNPSDYADGSGTETVNLPTYADTPVMVRLKKPKHVRLALELIDKCMREHEVACVLHEFQDFSAPYESTEALLDRGMIVREVRSIKDEAVFYGNKVIK